MNLTNKGMVAQALERIDLWQEHIKAVQAAQYRLAVRPRNSDKEPAGADLYYQLVEAELDEWRGLFMWALTLDDKDRDRIKAAARQRFLNDQTSVSEWFLQQANPSSWLVADEEAFREMARKAFAPREMKP